MLQPHIWYCWHCSGMPVPKFSLLGVSPRLLLCVLLAAGLCCLLCLKLHAHSRVTCKVTLGPAKSTASLCNRLRAAPLAASARACSILMSLCSFGTQLGVPLWWWSGSGSPPGSPCAPPLFLPSHYKVFLTSPATVMPLSPSQSSGVCDCRGTSLDVCTVSHESHSSLLLEISHFFSCCQPATSLGWCSISLWEHAPMETVWHVPGSWTWPLCG